MELNKLIENVQQWSTDRGLDKADSKKQLLKLCEEYGELASGIAKKQPGVIMDSIGDCVVVLIILAQQQSDEIDCIYPKDRDVETMFNILSDIETLYYSILTNWETEHRIKKIIGLLNELTLELGYKFEDCLEMAWNAIKDRKGKLVDGVWVKEEDLPAGEVSPEQTLDAVVEDDVVNNPSHYQGRNGLEAVEVMKQFAPCPEYIEGGYWFNTLKYLLRHHKKNGVQDLLKGLRNLVWYISCLFDKQKLADQLEEMAQELRNGDARKGIRSV